MLRSLTTQNALQCTLLRQPYVQISRGYSTKIRGLSQTGLQYGLAIPDMPSDRLRNLMTPVWLRATSISTEDYARIVHIYQLPPMAIEEDIRELFEDSQFTV